MWIASVVCAGVALGVARMRTHASEARPASAAPAAAAASAADGAASATPGALQPLLPFLGAEWRIKATWSNGTPLEARSTYEWGLAKKFIVARTYVKRPDGTEYQRYESLYADKDGELVMYGFTYAGTVNVSTMLVDGKTFGNIWTAKNADGKDTKFKQTVELVDNNHFRWQVWHEKDGQWSQMMDGTWERVATATTN
jgi:hypothetical protein